MLRQVRVWSEVHGLGFHLLGPRRRSVSRLALRLLLAQETAPATLLRRHHLDRALPLRLLSGQPMWDHSAGGSDRGAGAARSIAAFLLDCAARRPLVLRVEHGGSDRLTREVVTILRRRIETDPGPRSGGGLLLLVDRRARARPTSRGVVRSSAGSG